MIGRCPKAAAIAGTLMLAVFVTAAVRGQVAPDAAGAESPLASLVLVLNVLSDTHARPATGVVIRGAAPGPALVLVPAGFVAAGDEIIVLDGGTDILQHGRQSRTVARSADTGVALLEVEGLDRPGVEISSNPWPPEGLAELEFAAWPGAEKLAEGAPLSRSTLQLHAGELGSEAPAVSGPLFDPCGRLASFHLAGDDSRLVAGAAIARYLESAGYESVQAPCEAPAAEVAGVDAQPVNEAVSAQAVPPDPATPGGPPAAMEPGRPAMRHWIWAGGLLALATVAVFLALNIRRKRAVLELTGTGGGNHGERLALPLVPGGTAMFQRDGHSLLFELKGGRMLCSERGSEEAPRLGIAIDGTPCLPGEVFVIEPGQELRTGSECWRLQFDPEVTS